MKVNRQGVTRVVILTKKYAIKIPYITHGWKTFIVGIYSNLSEYDTWINTESEYLCPTLFSLFGIVNVMPNLKICNGSEQGFIDYPREDYDDYKPENYGIFNGKVVCIDYPYHHINKL